MSVKATIVKAAINWTPKTMVIWVANKILKGIAELSDFTFNLDTRKAFVQATLYGETEPIEVSLDGFAIVSEENGNYLLLQQGQSNKPWLNNILARITEKKWKIPVIPKYAKYIDLVIELLQTESIIE